MPEAGAEGARNATGASREGEDNDLRWVLVGRTALAAPVDVGDHPAEALLEDKEWGKMRFLVVVEVAGAVSADMGR